LIVAGLDNRAKAAFACDMVPTAPAIFNQAAKLIVDIASGKLDDREPTPEELGKDPAAVALGRKGGAARAANILPERRVEIARKAAAKRWKKD
jgi:hypothetical protein